MSYQRSDVENLETLIRSLDVLNEIKYLKINYSDLGGADKASLFIHASLDNKEDWINGIFHNSRYVIFALHNDNKMELISKGLNMPKFRKCKVKSLEDIAARFVKYCVEV